MSSLPQQITHEAMGLSDSERLALADLLIRSATSKENSESAAAWDREIRDRLRAVDEGRVEGVAYEEVMRRADTLLRA